MVIPRLIWFVICITCSSAIFEDQAGVLDWFHKYVGRVKFSAFDTGSTPKYYYVGSESNVIGLINLRDGSLVWRQVLEEDATLSAFNLCNNNILSLSTGRGAILRAWDAKIGSILWERLLSSEISNANMWCNNLEKFIVVSYGSNVEVLNLHKGGEIWTNKGDVEASGPSNSLITEIGAFTAESVTLLIVEQFDSEKLSSSSGFRIKLLTIPKHSPQLTSMTSFNYELPSDVESIRDCVVTMPPPGDLVRAVLLCTSSGQQQLHTQLYHLPITFNSSTPNAFYWQSIQINKPASKINKLTDSLFLLTSSDNTQLHTTPTRAGRSSTIGTDDGNAIIYNVDITGKPVVKYAIENASYGCLGYLDQEAYLFTIYQHKNKLFKNVDLNIYNLHTGQLSTELGSRQFTLAEHHGAIESMSAVMFNDVNGLASFRLIIHTEDHAVQVVRQNGQQQWIREEALASIVAVELVDLPVSDIQAKMDDEFGHSNNNIFEMFVRRLKTQSLQFVDRLKLWFLDLPNLFVTVLTSPSIAASLFSQPSNVKSTNSIPNSGDEMQSNCVAGVPPRFCLFSTNDSQTVSEASTDSNSFNLKMSTIGQRSKRLWADFLTRDTFNIHKMLVVATSVGKLFGLENERGRVVWEHLVKSTTLLTNRKLAFLFQQRNTAHFPLPPLMTLLLRSKTDNLPILYSFNPITGTPSNELGADLHHVQVDILQASLHPSSPNEKFKFIRPIQLLQTDFKVTFYPPQSWMALNTPDAKPSYIYTVENELSIITGYYVHPIKSSYLLATDVNDTSSVTHFEATRMWRIVLSPEDRTDEDKRHVIVTAASRPPNEHIHSVGRVLGDRSVLYKYLNPNLIAVLTVGGHVANHTNSVRLYLIDVVTGQVLHTAVHRRCTEPISLVHSENWILYTYYNHKSLRNEITVLELYEPVDPITGDLCSANIIPSPWQLFLSNLIPANWLTSLPLQPLRNTLFSSISRAADSWTNSQCGSHGQNGLVPQILQQSYILTTPPRSGAAAVSITERGITTKSVILGLQKNGLVELAKTFFDPRRALDITPDLMEEGVHPYTPVLPLSDKSMLSYNQSVMRIRSIRTAQTGLESTGLVFAYGLDLFSTRVAPSQTYDLLKEDFDYIAIATVTTSMVIASVVTSHLATRRAIYRAWA